MHFSRVCFMIYDSIAFDKITIDKYEFVIVPNIRHAVNTGTLYTYIYTY